MKKFIYQWVTAIILSFACLSLAAAATVKEVGNFLVISDIHLDTTSTHPMDIMPKGFDPTNDLDQPTFINLLDTLQKNIQSGAVPNPQFIVFLGDVVGHIRSTSKFVTDSETEVFAELKKHFPQTPIFYVFGNNDSLDVNYGVFRNIKIPKPQSPYDVATNSGWADGFLSTGTQCGNNIYPCLLPIKDDTNKTFGYYAGYIQPKLRIIALNTVLFSVKRAGTTEDQAQAELNDFLVPQLQDARAKGDSVLIATHIPPGFNVYDHSPFYIDQDNTAFVKILNQYQDVIIGVLAAHTHMDEAKILRDAQNHPFNTVLMNGALSTSHGNMPAVRTIYFAAPSQPGHNWTLTNYETFHYTDANTLTGLYDYNSLYCTNPNQSILDCLSNVNADKMKKYFSIGNTLYSGQFQYPDDIYITIGAKKK